MIFTNKELKAKAKEMDFGTLYQIVCGEYGRGRKEFRLACPQGTKLEKGCNFDYTIGETKSGRPRINKFNDNKKFFILSSEGGYTRRGNGWIGSWKKNQGNYKVLAKGNGADGDAGRIGWWDVLLVELTNDPDNDWIRIRTSGGGYGTSPDWLLISHKGIFFFNNTDDARMFADELDIEFPDLDNCDDIMELFNDLNN